MIATVGGEGRGTVRGTVSGVDRGERLVKDCHGAGLNSCRDCYYWAERAGGLSVGLSVGLSGGLSVEWTGERD